MTRSFMSGQKPHTIITVVCAETRQPIHMIKPNKLLNIENKIKRTTHCNAIFFIPGKSRRRTRNPDSTQDVENTVCFRPVFSIFYSPMTLNFDTEMNASDFGVKRSNLKVTVKYHTDLHQTYSTGALQLYM